MSFIIVRQDITKMKVDAIVNAANTSLQMGGGVCGAIFKAAGAHELQAACDKLAPIKTGEAVLTPGFALPAKYIIHTAGPVYSRNNAEQCEQLLRSAYLNSLQLAIQHKCESIAFPLISSGIYGYPKDEALKVATSAIQDFLVDHDLEVYLAVFDKAAFVISEKLLGAVASYIDEHYVDEHEEKRRELLEVERLALQNADVLKEADLKSYKPQISQAAISNLVTPSAAVPRKGLDELIGNLDEPFSTTLLRLIDAKGKTDVEVYKRANIDRKLFSKIRTGKGYMPGKRTIIALAVALELSIEETDDLLMRAGYALSHSQKFDVIVEYFIINGKYDIFEINEVLFQYDLPLLGG
jgi:O-acetyl-ADP-ribose deacetylase (regulator of RNase III)